MWQCSAVNIKASFQLCLQVVLYFSIAQFWDFILFQVLLARHKAEEQFYAVKVLQKKAILKKKEVSCFFVMPLQRPSNVFLLLLLSQCTKHW